LHRDRKERKKKERMWTNLESPLEGEKKKGEVLCAVPTVVKRMIQVPLGTKGTRREERGCRRSTVQQGKKKGKGEGKRLSFGSEERWSEDPLPWRGRRRRRLVIFFLYAQRKKKKKG